MKVCDGYHLSPTKQDFQDLKQLQAVLGFEVDRFKGELKIGTVEDLISDLVDETE